MKNVFRKCTFLHFQLKLNKNVKWPLTWLSLQPALMPGMEYAEVVTEAPDNEFFLTEISELKLSF